MRIAQVAPPVESVPPIAYGGTERVVATLTEELVRRGHTVTLFAAGDSVTSARLIPTVEVALWHWPQPPANALPFWTLTLGRVLHHAAEFDLIHNHLDFFGLPLVRSVACPVVTTLHGRLDLAEFQPLWAEFREAPLISISDSQRQPVPAARWLATIHHGIDLRGLDFQPQSGDYLAFLGRISPEKGLDTAIRVARRTGWPLKIAARPPLPPNGDPIIQADWDYYDQVIAPLLAEPGVELIGEINDDEKGRFLGGAAALLFPIRWPEPFGLVMPEAMACGTPVIALRAGSVPEVVEQGVTGWIADDEEGLVQAVARIDQLDRAACRAVVERRFSPAVMAAAYERVYAALAGPGR